MGELDQTMPTVHSNPLRVIPSNIEDRTINFTTQVSLALAGPSIYLIEDDQHDPPCPQQCHHHHQKTPRW